MKGTTVKIEKWICHPMSIWLSSVSWKISTEQGHDLPPTNVRWYLMTHEWTQTEQEAMECYKLPVYSINCLSIQCLRAKPENLTQSSGHQNNINISFLLVRRDKILFGNKLKSFDIYLFSFFNIFNNKIIIDLVGWEHFISKYEILDIASLY